MTKGRLVEALTWTALASVALFAIGDTLYKARKPAVVVQSTPIPMEVGIVLPVPPPVPPRLIGRALHTATYGRTDFVLFTAPVRFSSGEDTFIVYELNVLLLQSPAGTGTVWLSCGTTEGGEELLRKQKITAASAQGRAFGLAKDERGTAFKAAQPFAVLGAGKSAACRTEIEGVLNTEAIFAVKLFGEAL